jgi:hypothetical protein
VFSGVEIKGWWDLGIAGIECDKRLGICGFGWVSSLRFGFVVVESCVVCKVMVYDGMSDGVLLRGWVFV